MKKRIESQVKEIRTSNEKSKFSLGILALVSFCSFLIVIATFSKLSLFYYSISFDALFDRLAGVTYRSAPVVNVNHYEYIPQIPVVVYVAALLGPIYASISVLIYIVLGLSFFPIFALGGGPKYILQYNFGYILAYLPAVILVAKSLKKKFSYRDSFKACFLAVLSVHVIGIMYSIIMGLIRREPYEFILDWIIAQSFSKMIYDFLFSFFAIIAAKVTKRLLWLIMG